MASIYFWMPKLPQLPNTQQSDGNQGLKNPELWALILLTTIGTGGFFAWYSYIAPLITEVAGLADYMIGYAMIIRATMVFPEPTSPCRSRFIWALLPKSARISLITFFWALVNSKGR